MREVVVVGRDAGVVVREGDVDSVRLLVEGVEFVIVLVCAGRRSGGG